MNNLGYNKLSSMICIATLLLMCTGNIDFVSQFAYGQLEDELELSTKNMRQYTRSTERLTEFVKICQSRASSGDFSLISTCDSVIQKYNIEMGHFYKENQPIIEELIYPYQIPAAAENSIGQDSSNVTGTSDQNEFLKHGSTTIDYSESIVKVLDECSNSSAYDLDMVRKCIAISNSLNDKMKNINTNAKLELDKVLELGRLENSLSGNSNYDSP
jgi:hypothetical protein